VIMAVVIRRRVKVVTVSVGAEKLMHPYPHVTGIPEKASAAQATASLAAALGAAAQSRASDPRHVASTRFTRSRCRNARGGSLGMASIAARNDPRLPSRTHVSKGWSPTRSRLAIGPRPAPPHVGHGMA
jgi:hypothetical protein